MSKDNIIRTAEFDPRVKTYWLLSGAIICCITLVGIPLLLVWLPFGLFFTGRYLRRMECQLTNKALKVKKGIMVRTEKTIPLEKITDMGMVQGPVMRFFDIHKLTVETAGQSGQGALVSLVGIVDAKDFREAVLAQRDEVATVPGTRSGENVASSTPGEPQALTDVRDSLLRIEALLSDMAAHQRRS